ncbi:MAG: hypothetical protein ACWA44_04785 [Thiotrichales bacterium]
MTELKANSNTSEAVSDVAESGVDHSKRIWLAGFVVLAMIFLFLLSFVGEQKSKQPGAIAAPEVHLLPGERARGLLQRMDRASLEQARVQETLFSEANSFFNNGNYADAYISYFALAREGHGGAAMKLAEMSDPRTAGPFTEQTGGPNYAQAVKWYQLAAEKGVKGAKEKLDGLLAALRSASRKGDLAAQRVLLEVDQ